MKMIPLPVVFALGTAICWGLYGPTLGQARSPERLYSPFKPYVGIGLAYILWAFIGGMIAMKFNGDSFVFTGKEVRAGSWGFLAGTLGALGALSLTTAMFKGGAAMPQIVMPVVFGGAVSISAIVSVVQLRGKESPSPWLWVGIAGMVICVVVVAYNTPHAHPPKKPGASPQAGETASSAGEAEH
jgi:drug/metabolite transporter (DMT)-like permease